MKVHVYDTHVDTQDGQHIHFDVLVNDENIEHVQQFVEQYLASIELVSNNIKLQRCNFCHSEIAKPEVQQDIMALGHSIIRLS